MEESKKEGGAPRKAHRQSSTRARESTKGDITNGRVAGNGGGKPNGKSDSGAKPNGAAKSNNEAKGNGKALDDLFGGPFADNWRKLIALGYSPVPLHPYFMRGKGKAPCVQNWTALQFRTITEEEVSRLRGHLGVGAVCGFNNLMGLDFDTLNKRAQRVIRRKMEELGLPCRVGNPEKAGLFIARWGGPGLVPNQKFPAADGGGHVLELLGSGTQFVIPPTIHPDTGEPYRMAGGGELPPIDDIPWLAPEKLQEILDAIAPFCAKPPVLKDKRLERHGCVTRDPLPPPDKPATKQDKAYARKGLKNEASILANTADGARNDTLNSAVHSMATMAPLGWISEEEVRKALFAAWEKTRLDGESEAEREEEFERTFDSAWRAGIKKPRLPLDAPERKEGWLGAPINNSTKLDDGPCVDAETGEIIDGPPPERDAKGAGAPDGGKKKRVELICAKDIKPKAISWVWPNWLARGKLHVIAGAKGDGKSTSAFAFAAIVSTGGLWPDGARAEPGNVLIWSGEDGKADTIIPRLMAAGANLSRIFILSAVTENGRKRSFDPATDLADIEAMAAGVPDGKIDLLMIDPMVSAVKAGKNSHNNAETRQGLQHVVDFTEKHNCATLGVHHLTKGTKGNDPVERLTGSLAFGAIPRVVLMTAKKQVADDGPSRLLVRAASNIGPSGGAFGYDIEQRFVHDEDGVVIPATRVKWGSYIEEAAKALVDAAEATEEPEEKKRPATAKAKAFLIRILKDGPKLATEIFPLAEADGITVITLKRAKKELCIVSKLIPRLCTWKWSLPSDDEEQG